MNRKKNLWFNAPTAFPTHGLNDFPENSEMGGIENNVVRPGCLAINTKKNWSRRSVQRREKAQVTHQKWSIFTMHLPVTES